MRRRIASRAGGPPRRRRGVTLLELSVVLAITAIAALLVAPSWGAPGDPDAAVRAPSATFAALLHDARRQARESRQTVAVRINARAGRVRIDTSGANGDGVWRVLPLAGELAAAIVGREAPATFVFLPTGAAFGDTLRLRLPGGSILFAIDPRNGEVIRATP